MDHGNAKFLKEYEPDFLEWVRNGGSIRAYAEKIGITHGCIVKYMSKEKNADFRHQYREAFDDALLIDIDDMMHIAKDGSNDFEVAYDDLGKPAKAILRNEYIQRSKLIVETIQWQAKRRMPKDWGDKIVDDEGKSVTNGIAVHFLDDK